MVEELVVRDTLSDEMIQAGAEIVQQLDKLNFPVETALWRYLPELRQWRLMLASPEIKIHGPKKGYEKVQAVLSKLAPRLSLQNISLVDSSDPLILSLKQTMPDKTSISGLPFRWPSSNGGSLEDAYIYRLQ